MRYSYNMRWDQVQGAFQDSLPEGNHSVEGSPFFASLPNLPAITEKFLHSQEARDFSARVQQSHPTPPPRPAHDIAVDLRVEAADAARIPVSGAVIVVANRSFGRLDEALLATLLKRVRPDVRILSRLPRMADLPLIEFEALEWLGTGGMLAVFPSGETPHWHFAPSPLPEPKWHSLPLNLLRKSSASALPVYICGALNLALFASRPQRPRTASPLQKFLRQHPPAVEIRIGTEIPRVSLASIANDHEATEYLRWRTHLLARRSRPQKSWPLIMRSKISARIASQVEEPLADPKPSALIAAELSALPADRLLVESGDFTVYLAKAADIPNTLFELGRLRELTFRGAGEGTGRSRDLDRFDRYYWHILLWNKIKQELVGAYRAGNTAEILAQHGIKGLYTSTLFRYDPAVFEKLGPALELGRSFVRPEYQRQYAPLLLLWKAIARLLATQPQIAVVFGPVSISDDYSQASREMIYRFFESRMQEDELARLITPRKPFRPAGLRPWDCRAMCQALHDLEDLSEPITDLEPDGKGLPILLRQYAKIGGRLLSFNVDKKFANVLDGLVVVDLRKTDAAVLERYMGREAAAQFRRTHKIVS
jgi:putative hemolysin